MDEKNEVEKNTGGINEWKEYENDPSHWLGGKIPPQLLQKNKKLGMTFFAVSFIWLVLAVISFSFYELYLSTGTLAFALLCFCAGYIQFK